VTVWRVLVLDASERQALAACRTLGRAGHHVETAGYAAAELAGDSRHSRRYTRLPGAEAPALRFEQALADAVRAHRSDVVIATNDATLARLGTVTSPIPTLPRVDAAFIRLADKAELADVCAAAGVAAPPTFLQRVPADADEAVRAVGLPAVVKAARSAEADATSVRFRAGAEVAGSLDEVRAAVARVHDQRLRPVVQQRIAGLEKLNAVVIRRERRSVFRYAHRVVREAPRSGGIGVTLETIEADRGAGAEAIDVLERICDAAGYEGLAHVEFYRDARDGMLCAIDVNPVSGARRGSWSGWGSA
jgi:predicted ATP-grasp superfamily ATP-dependent carboligase